MTALKKIFPYLVLFVILLVLFAANYVPRTILSGWDTLHPEFNFPLAFERSFYGVWRQDQGLGAVAAHSHMSELPRIMLMWIASLIFPQNSLRYLFFFSCLILGVLGMNYLLNNLLKETKHRTGVSFLGALAYLTNLGSVQHFIVPFEMFAVQYAALPWIFGLSIAWIHKKNKILLFCLFAAIVLSSPMAYAATLWYAFFVIYTLVMLSVTNWKKALFLIVSILLLNSYWLFPNIYFSINHGEEVRNSKINRLFSSEAFAKNQEYGNVLDTSLIKNFLFDWSIYIPEKFIFQGVTDAWSTHLGSPLLRAIGASVFAISIVGIVYTLWKGLRVYKAFLFVFIIPFGILLNGTWPITIIFKFISNISPTLQEALRFPFTKFSLLYMVGLIIFFSIAIHEGFSRIVRIRSYSKYIILIFSVLLLVYFLPGFKGSFVHPSMKIEIPKEYFEMFNWFNTKEKDARVALLPVHSFWGWAYYSWGFQGAGFLQFGIKQPILDRDYDRWNYKNEQYFREMSSAIYAQNSEKLKAVLVKYGVSYILLDKSILTPGNSENVTLNWLIPQLLEDTSLVNKPIQFGNYLYVYEINQKPSTLGLVNSLPIVSNEMKGAPEDVVFKQIGDYKKVEGIMPNINVIQNFTYDERYIGPISQKQLLQINSESKAKFVDLYPCGTNFKLNGTRELNSGVITYKSSNGPLCDFFTLQDTFHDKGYIISFTSKNISGFPIQFCISNNLTKHCDISNHLGDNKEFKTERFYLLESKDNGIGYTININNYSIRNQESINEIQDISVYEVERNQVYGNELLRNEKTEKMVVEYYYQNPSMIIGNLVGQSQPSTIFFNNSFEKGWRAYLVGCENKLISCGIQQGLPFIFGTELKNHVLVNNWANGWELESCSLSKVGCKKDQKIVIFFLPQLLQWFGFALFPIPFLFLLKKARMH